MHYCMGNIVGVSRCMWWSLTLWPTLSTAFGGLEVRALPILCLVAIILASRSSLELLLGREIQVGDRSLMILVTFLALWLDLGWLRPWFFAGISASPFLCSTVHPSSFPGSFPYPAPQARREKDPGCGWSRVTMTIKNLREGSTNERNLLSKSLSTWKRGVEIKQRAPPCSCGVCRALFATATILTLT